MIERAAALLRLGKVLGSDRNVAEQSLMRDCDVGHDVWRKAAADATAACTDCTLSVSAYYLHAENIIAKSLTQPLLSFSGVAFMFALIYCSSDEAALLKDF